MRPRQPRRAPARAAPGPLDHLRGHVRDLELDLGGGARLLLFQAHRARTWRTCSQLLRQHHGALLVNPGSVGMPIRDYTGRAPTVLDHAEYAIVEARSGAVTVALQRVGLERTAPRDQARSTPHPLAAMLAAQYA